MSPRRKSKRARKPMQSGVLDVLGGGPMVWVIQFPARAVRIRTHADIGWAQARRLAQVGLRYALDHNLP